MPLPRTSTPSDAEREARLRASRAAAFWNQLSPEAMGRWRDYADAVTMAKPPDARTTTCGYNEFFTLSKKILQIDRTAIPPPEPPTGRFLGDVVAMRVEPFLAPEEADADGSDGVSGRGVAFVADRANVPGVLTELSLQRLANGGRLPTARGYRSQGFVAFGEALRAEIDVLPGWYACATRFVEAATGRTKELWPCGVVRVA